MAVTRVRIYGDSLAESRGRGNPLTVDPKGAMVYTIGYGLGLTDSQIVNNGVGGSQIADALQQQKATPAGGPGSLDILWTGHNDIRNRASYSKVQAVKDGYRTFYDYARSNGGDALLLGLTTGEGFETGTQGHTDVQDINTHINTFPVADRFISWPYLAAAIGSGLSVTCQVMIDAGLTPTAEDRGNIDTGVPPQSVRATTGVGHLNQIGYDTYGKRLVRHINSAPVDSPPGGYVGSLAAVPASPAPGVQVTFTATVTPLPNRYKLRYSDGSFRDYAASNTDTRTMTDVPLTATLDVQDTAGTNFVGVAALTVSSTPPPPSGNSAALIPFFANA